MVGDVGVVELVKLGVGSIEGSMLDLIALIRLIDKNKQYYDMVPMLS